MSGSSESGSNLSCNSCPFRRLSALSKLTWRLVVLMTGRKKKEFVTLRCNSCSDQYQSSREHTHGAHSHACGEEFLNYPRVRRLICGTEERLDAAHATPSPGRKRRRPRGGETDWRVKRDRRHSRLRTWSRNRFLGSRGNFGRRTRLVGEHETGFDRSIRGVLSACGASERRTRRGLRGACWRRRGGWRVDVVKGGIFRFEVRSAAAKVGLEVMREALDSAVIRGREPSLRIGRRKVRRSRFKACR